MSARAGIAAVILAGGQSRRMGGQDKAFLALSGRPLIAHVAARLRDQAAPLLVSANGDPARFAAAVPGLAILPDTAGDFPGPLAGILATMEHLAAQAPAIRWLASAPTDCPLLPADFVARLRQRQQERRAELVIAASGGREHPVCALWSCGLLPALRETVSRGEARVMAFVRSRAHAVVAWPASPFDPFFNVNTPADLACLDARA